MIGSATEMKLPLTSLFLNLSSIQFGKHSTSTSCFMSFVANGLMRVRACIHNHKSITMPANVLDAIDRRKRSLDVSELRQSILLEYISEESLGAIKCL